MGGPLDIVDMVLPIYHFLLNFAKSLKKVTSTQFYHSSR